MCTVTWLHDGDRYSLYCNRDELRTRQPALPPSARRSGATRFVAPIDGKAGGTWIAVNELGLSLCLLNDYSAAPRGTAGDFTSRGHLVTELIQAGDFDDLRSRWSAIDAQHYRPFKLLSLAPGGHTCLLSWDGSAPGLRVDDVVAPLCSSSFDEAGASRSRAQLFERTTGSTDLDPRKSLLHFHQSHRPERGPYSVCMHRPDAVTVSFTLVDVDATDVSMAYAHGAPCSAPLEHLATLDRST